MNEPKKTINSVKFGEIKYRIVKPDTDVRFKAQLRVSFFEFQTKPFINISFSLNKTQYCSDIDDFIHEFDAKTGTKHKLKQNKFGLRMCWYNVEANWEAMLKAFEMFPDNFTIEQRNLSELKKRIFLRKL